MGHYYCQILDLPVLSAFLAHFGKYISWEAQGLHLSQVALEETDPWQERECVRGAGLPEFRYKVFFLFREVTSLIVK